MSKPYNNKHSYDPGRFREKVKFLQEQTTDNGSGGVIVTLTTVLETKAVKERINDSSQLVIDAGITNLHQDRSFIIRSRRAFYPEKDMLVECDGEQYTIRGIIPIDDPVNYIRLLCARIDGKN